MWLRCKSGKMQKGTLKYLNLGVFKGKESLSQTQIL